MKRSLTQELAPWLVAGVVAVGAVACEKFCWRESSRRSASNTF